jgi:Gly-Xaa carboxypeptidase
LESGDEERIAQKLADNVEAERWLMQTSQAVDLIAGGIKVNALPELVEVLINHRIAPHQSIGFVNEHMKKVLTPLAEDLGIEVIGSDDMISNNVTLTPQFATGKLTFSYPESLEVSPISPTKGSGVWALFGGTVRYVFENTDSGKGKTVVPVGDIMTGNTDTQHYWNLTRNIYRFAPIRQGARLNAHAIDERMEMKAHVEGIRVYYGM